MALWTCPNCGRRVPSYAPACHCGTRRSDAALAAPPTSASRGRLVPRASTGARVELTREFWLWVAGFVLIVALGATWTLWPRQRQRMAPLLGIVDRPVSELRPKGPYHPPHRKRAAPSGQVAKP
jgi:hypothetical protein